MKIKELFESKLSNINLSNMTWFHGGGDFNKFSLDSIGVGENNHLLGRGIYFINNKNIAERYTKYAKTSKSALYEVNLNITGHIYNYRERMDVETERAFDMIATELGLRNHRDLYDIRGVSNMRDGVGLIGGVFFLCGSTKKAINMLKKYKIQGCYENVDAGVYEIAIFDESVIKIVKKDYVK
jgi:hypothetical protein